MKLTLLAALAAAFVAFGLDPAHAQAVQGRPTLPAASTAAEACHTFKATNGFATNIGGTAGQAEYILVIDANAAPANGAVTPIWWGYAAAQGAWSSYFNFAPLGFVNGLTICYSSTGPFTLTGVSTNNASWAQVG